jgi:hypothetical protein
MNKKIIFIPLCEEITKGRLKNIKIMQLSESEIINLIKFNMIRNEDIHYFRFNVYNENKNIIIK